MQVHVRLCPFIHAPTGTEGAVHFAGGTPFYGQVELCRNGEWGTVCDRGFGIQEATVICRQLSLPSKNKAMCIHDMALLCMHHTTLLRTTQL